jgi:hypothetical protein
MSEKRRCNVCNLDVSKTNWSKHIKTKKHLVAESNYHSLDAEQEGQVPTKHCVICDVDVPENEWINHLKSTSHKNNTELLKEKLKEKVRSLNIKKLRKRRKFEDINFETDDYIIKKV